MNANTTPTPVCEECDLEMHRFGGMEGNSYVEGWSCDGCGWSEDDEEYQTPSREPYQIEQEELFNEWKKIGLCFNDMAGIVQNDIKKYPITRHDVYEWLSLLARCRSKIHDLESRTLNFIDREGKL